MYNNEKKKRISKQNNLERSLLPAENSFSVTYENMESNKGNHTLIQKCDRDRNDNTATAPSVNNEALDEKGAQGKIEVERARLQPLIIALFATMFFSILQASFFAYVTSPVKGRDIEQILYFVRLFSDLLGRPLTRLCRSSYLKVRHPITCNPSINLSICLSIKSFPHLLSRMIMFLHHNRFQSAFRLLTVNSLLLTFACLSLLPPLLELAPFML